MTARAMQWPPVSAHVRVPACVRAHCVLMPEMRECDCLQRTMDNLLGRTLSAEEFAHYFSLFLNNPHKSDAERHESLALWHGLYAQFCRTDIEACQIPQVVVGLLLAHSLSRRQQSTHSRIRCRVL